jgi:cytidylate kinase
MRTQEKKEQALEKVITISREAGSGGRIVAKKLAESLGFDFFDQEIIHEMAESAKVDDRILQTLDEKGLNVLEHWISSLIHNRHL